VLARLRSLRLPRLRRFEVLLLLRREERREPLKDLFAWFIARESVVRGSSVMVGKDPSSLPVTNHFNILTCKYFRSGALLESCHGGLCVGCLLYLKSSN